MKGYAETADDIILLEMTRADYEQLMITLGIAAGAVGPRASEFARIFELINRLNIGKPGFVPYRIPPQSQIT